MRYSEPKADEWVQPVTTGYKLACCDCGLVHQVDFRVVDSVADKISPSKHRAQFRVRLDNRATAAMRRKKKE